MENSIEINSISQISKAQRRCLSHVLRNCEQAINGVLTLVENEAADFSPQDIANSVQSACRQLDGVLEAALAGSFCAIAIDDCSFVSTFVGCSGQPDREPGRNSGRREIVREISLVPLRSRCQF